VTTAYVSVQDARITLMPNAVVAQAESSERGWVPVDGVVHEVSADSVIYELDIEARTRRPIALVAARRLRQSRRLLVMEIRDEMRRGSAASRLLRAEDLCTTQDVAQRLGVRPATVSKWKARAARIGFPRPLVPGVWSVEDIDLWALSTGRADRETRHLVREREVMRLRSSAPDPDGENFAVRHDV
jgi:hypothetical protein